jgi:hypothetical protein
MNRERNFNFLNIAFEVYSKVLELDLEYQILDQP